MQKKYIIFIIIIIFFILIGIGIYNIPKTNNYLKFNKDGYLLTYKTSSAGDSSFDDWHYRLITIYNNGNGEISAYFPKDRYSDEFDKKVTVEFNLDESKMNSLQSYIARTGFVNLEKDLSTDSVDGTYKTMTIYLKNGVYEVHGLNIENKNFNLLVESMCNIIGKDLFDEYNRKFEDFQSQRIK